MSKIVNVEELKSVVSISKHYPVFRKTGGVLNLVRIGTTPKTVYDAINNGKLKLDSVIVDGTRYFIVPLEDQQKEDWGLGERLHLE